MGVAPGGRTTGRYVYKVTVYRFRERVQRQKCTGVSFCRKLALIGGEGFQVSGH